MIAVIFEVVPINDRKDEYFKIAGELKHTLVQMDGFISIERFQSLTNKNHFLSLSFWQDENSVIAWRDQINHRSAQKKGRSHIFSDYRLRVANVIRDYGMNNRTEAPKEIN